MYSSTRFSVQISLSFSHFTINCINLLNPSIMLQCKKKVCGQLNIVLISCYLLYHGLIAFFLGLQCK